MSTILWRGDAAAVAQANTLTVGSPAAGVVYAIAINGKTVSYTATAGDTAATAATGLYGLLVAFGTPPEFKEIAWTNPSDGVIVATAAAAGTPFVLSASATGGGGGGTLGNTATTASAGPADASTAANYSGGALPTSGDDLTFTGTANSCLFGLSALSGVALGSITIDQSFTGKIGLARGNPAGYIEYRPRYLQCAGATTVTIGNGPGMGSGRIAIDTLAGQSAIDVANSASPVDPGVKTILWKGTHAANVVNLTKGSFAAAYLEGETAAVATWNCGYQTNQAGDVDAYAGAGTSLTTINKTGGTLVINSSFTTLNQGPGSAGETIIAAGTPGALNVSGGNVRYRNAGNYTAITTIDSGYVDFSQGTSAVTGTNTTCNPGSGAINDPAKRITFTNPLLITGQLADYPNLDLGANFHIQRS
jgi:hypothetical protein